MALYESQGGNLTRKWTVGVDPLCSCIAQQQLREHLFALKYSFEDIFEQVVRGDQRLFVKGLKYFINLSFSLAS